MTVTKKELGRRIKEAREACRMTQEAVAEKLEVSRSSVAQIENGNRAVSSIELDKLSYLFGRDIRDFLGDKPIGDDPLLALFRLHTDISDQEKLLEALRMCIALGRELSNLERLLGIDRDIGTVTAYPLQNPSSKWDAIRQGDWMSREERRRLGLGRAPLPNFAEILETQGIRTATEVMPLDVSGLTLIEPKLGFFVVANWEHGVLRRRFSYAHEYCHVLADRDGRGIISRTGDQKKLVEVRANAFAAGFLMPEEGVRSFMRSLGKGREGTIHSALFDGEEAVPFQARAPKESQEIKFYDVVQLAHHFKVSRSAALFRLLNLGLITKAELESLMEMDQNGRGNDIADALGLQGPNEEEARDEFKHRFLGLGFEALRRGSITRSKLNELAGMVNVSSSTIDETLSAIGLDDTGSSDDVVLPTE